MLIECLLTGVFIGLVFKNALHSDTKIWRFLGTTGMVLFGVVVAGLTFYRNAMPGLGNSIMAVSGMGGTAVASDLIIMGTIRWISRRANAPKGNTIIIAGNDPEILKQFAPMLPPPQIDTSKMLEQHEVSEKVKKK